MTKPSDPRAESAAMPHATPQLPFATGVKSRRHSIIQQKRRTGSTFSEEKCHAVRQISHR
jgi:hypothetical protein